MQEANKYLFDRNNFDLGADFDPDHPPAPTFSEEELATARAQGFADGVKKGLADAQASRDQQIVALTQKISADLKVLFAAEETRNTRFETELIALAQALFTRAFPILNEAIGQDQITAIITETLRELSSQASVTIETSTQDHDDLSQRLKPHLAAYDGQMLILPHQDLEPGSFRMKWQDGGALRDSAQVMNAMIEKLETVLAGTGTNKVL